MGGFVSCADDDTHVRQPSHMSATPAAGMNHALPPHALILQTPTASASNRHARGQTNTRYPLPPPHFTLNVPTRDPMLAMVDVHANARIAMEATPNGKEKLQFQFFCPICFCHYKEIYKSMCCSNYVCVPCGLAHITQRLSLPTLLTRMPVGSIGNVCCPSCNSENVTFAPVHIAKGEKPRNYVESPHTRDILSGIEKRQKGLALTSSSEGSGGEKENEAPSRNTSFGHLKQKILDFESVKGDDDNQARENSVSRSTALPPRRPLQQAAQQSQPQQPQPASALHSPIRITRAIPSQQLNLAPPLAPIPSLQETPTHDAHNIHSLVSNDATAAVPSPILTAGNTPMFLDEEVTLGHSTQPLSILPTPALSVN